MFERFYLGISLQELVEALEEVQRDEAEAAQAGRTAGAENNSNDLQTEEDPNGGRSSGNQGSNGGRNSGNQGNRGKGSKKGNNKKGNRKENNGSGKKKNNGRRQNGNNKRKNNRNKFNRKNTVPLTGLYGGPL